MNRNNFKDKNIIFVSYFSSIVGMVMAEWADDKIKALSELVEEKVYFLTGICSRSISSDKIKVYKVPPLSPSELYFDLVYFRVNKSQYFLKYFWLLPFQLSFGAVYDLIFRIFVGKNNPARWSWAISTFPLILFLKMRFSIKVCVTTSGAASAALAGALARSLIQFRLITEFQDPIISSYIKRNTLNEKIVRLIEKFIVRNSSKIVYVTKNAARMSRRRNTRHSKRIYAIYPGSFDFKNINMYQNKKIKTDVIYFCHLGTLYAERNLSTFFTALKMVVDLKLISKNRIKIVNIGADYTKYNFSSFKYKKIEAMDRINALREASKADYLLLIQHTDERSRETIPYKFYDYLNLGLPIFALVNNPELALLVKKFNGISCNINAPELIKIAILEAKFRLRNRKSDIKSHPTIAIDKQIRFLIK